MDEDNNSSNSTSANSSHVDAKKLTTKLSAADILGSKMMEGLKVREEVKRRASTGDMKEEGEKLTDTCMARRGSTRKDVNALPPAFYVPMRKQSSGDLQSRLKTRKLLGVGENEDGSVPLSKISQILGHDDHYLINLPAGLRLWQVTTAVAFTAIASLAMCFPVGLIQTVFATPCGKESVLPIRLFGGAITCLALLYWSAIKSVSRHIIRWTLLTEILYLTIQTLVMFISLLGSGSFNFSSILVLGLFLMSAAISIHFYATLSGISSKWLWATYQAITTDLTGSDKND